LLDKLLAHLRNDGLPAKQMYYRVPATSTLWYLECLGRIGELLDAHPNLNIRLLWLPRSIPPVGFKRAKQLALEAIHTADLRGVGSSPDMPS
jgi:hypothetical protein